MDEFFTKGSELFGKSSPKLMQGSTVTSLAVSCYQVGDGFGLYEVELTIEKGPLRKFSGFSDAAPFLTSSFRILRII